MWKFLLATAALLAIKVTYGVILFFMLSHFLVWKLKFFPHVTIELLRFW